MRLAKQMREGLITSPVVRPTITTSIGERGALITRIVTLGMEKAVKNIIVGVVTGELHFFLLPCCLTFPAVAPHSVIRGGGYQPREQRGEWQSRGNKQGNYYNSRREDDREQQTRPNYRDRFSREDSAGGGERPRWQQRGSAGGGERGMQEQGRSRWQSGGGEGEDRGGYKSDKSMKRGDYSSSKEYGRGQGQRRDNSEYSSRWRDSNSSSRGSGGKGEWKPRQQSTVQANDDGDGWEQVGRR